MKTAPSFLKVILSFIFSFIFTFKSGAQVNIINPYAKITMPIPATDAIPLVNCNPTDPIGCNYIQNHTFTPSSNYFNPYTSNTYLNPFNFDGLGNSLIPGWDVSHGTPTVYDGITLNDPLPPSNASGYFMGVTGYSTSAGGWFSEGVAQKIPRLSANSTYTLSFYKMFKDYTGHPLDNLKIVLMRCQDYTTTCWPVTYQIPSLPAISQTIYCETSIQNTTWDQVFIKFTPDYAYDMIWIYPEGNHDNQNKFAGVFVSFPELNNISNFSAGPTPNPTPPTCKVMIGPASPNCAPAGAVFTWTGPNGQTPIVPPNQQIEVDASQPGNVGTWTLSMTMPNAVVTNSTCGIQQPVITASVNVAACTIATCPPQILSSSYYDPGCNNPHQPVIPYTLNHYCNPWECGGRIYLESNFSTGNQWYVNDVLIVGNGGDIPNVGGVWIWNNTKNLMHRFSQNAPQNTIFKFQLKNTTQGCEQLTTPTFVFYGETLFPLESMGHYKPNYTRNINIPFGYTVGPGTIYTWNIPGAVITDPDNSTPEASVYFPSSIPLPNVYGTLTVTNSPYCNGTYNLVFDYNPNAFSEVRTSDNNIEQNTISIFPNPASNQITISSKKPIISIEISDLMNPIVKRNKVNGTKSTVINVSDLKPGIYNCKISTSKGIENQKLIIKR